MKAPPHGGAYWFEFSCTIADVVVFVHTHNFSPRENTHFHNCKNAYNNYVEDWFNKYKKSEEEVSSIASNQPTSQPAYHTHTEFQQPQQPQPLQAQPTQPQPQQPREAITQLGSSYEIKKVAKTPSKKTNFPTALLIIAVVTPLLFVFVMGVFSNKSSKEDKKADNFLYTTLESAYFTLNLSPNYTVNSVVDKKVPFLERHIMENNKDGQKTLTILVKDVQFDYDVQNNLGVKARQSSPQMYSEESYQLGSLEGLYYKKLQENFEHHLLLVDRSKSVLYEITMNSPTAFSDDYELGAEFRDILDRITFIN